MSQYLPLMAAGAAFLAVIGIAFFAMSAARSSRKRALIRRLSDASTGRAPRRGSKDEWVGRLAERGQQLDQLLLDPAETSVLLAQAGWRGARARATFFAVQTVLPLLVLLAAIPAWFVLTSRLEVMPAALTILGGVIVGILLPRWVLRSVASRRRDRIAAEIPLFINLLILLFEAGLSTRQALLSLVQDGHETLPTLVDELEPVLRQIEAGGDLGALLAETGRMLQVPELDSVLGILRQVERYGGEIREPLTDALTTIEERRTLELRETVNVLSGKMTVVLVFCFLPAVLILIIGPAVASIIRGFSTL
ncbi:MAG: hypothetical protein CMN28_06510 [Salinisphaeraceae bacterium]|nr:hypothetical protein [Salinisphaeraceae bacterium]